jgi:hypothetical protein
VRIIYVDEAGISSHEPITVVVGVIVHGDTQWIAAAHAIREALLRWVPTQLYDEFVFHAKDLVSKKYRGVWEFEKRLALLHQMMAIPREMNLPLAVGIGVKAKIPVITSEWMGKLSKDEVAHAAAFGCSMAMVGKFLRERGGIREIGMVVAEDLPEMRAALKRTLLFLRLNERRVRLVKGTSESGEPISGDVQFSAREVVDTVHFAAKSEATFLQLADACAFGLRRFASGLPYGDDYGKLIIGPDANLARIREVLTGDEASAALYHDSHPARVNIRYSLG